MYKGTTHNLKKDGMHRPEGAGNFDNMDDYLVEEISVVSATEPITKSKGSFWYDTGATGSAVSSTVNIVTKTSAYTLTSNDVVVLANGTFTITIPTAVGIEGKTYDVKNIGTGSVTLDPNGAQTIDGDTTKILNTLYDSLTIISDGSNWHII